MNPTCQSDKFTLYLYDCLEYLRTLPDKSIDVVIADPPYGVDLGNHEGAKETRKGLLVKNGGYEDTPQYFDDVIVPAIRECLRISNRSLIFGVPPHIWKFPPPDVIGGFYIPSACGRNRWGWSTFAHVLMYGTAPNLNLGAKPTGKHMRTNIGDDTGHPTTKPTNWMRWLVELGSSVGDTVLDPFMGSGTTGVACLQLNRRFIGIEIDPNYYAIAEKRIKQYAMQDVLFSV